MRKTGSAEIAANDAAALDRLRAEIHRLEREAKSSGCAQVGYLLALARVEVLKELERRETESRGMPN